MSADDCLYMGSDGVCCELYLGGSQMAATLSNKGRRLSSALGGASSPSERAEMRFNWIGGKDIKSGLFVASFPGLMGESNSVGRGVQNGQALTWISLPSVVFPTDESRTSCHCITK